jgi:hypothetical protein
MLLSDLIFLKDTLEDAKAEYEELNEALDYFVSYVPDRLEAALEIVNGWITQEAGGGTAGLNDDDESLR